MIFSSLEYLIFFIFFILVLKIFKKNQQNLILIFSLFFYAFWNIYFVTLILFFCFFTYFFIKKNVSLRLSITIILLPLVYFKYSDFLFGSLNLKFLNNIIYEGEIPLAISFITFTAIAAIIDIKNKFFDKSYINFLDLSEFILFFPQLIAGPILRLDELIFKLRNQIIFEKKNIKFGLLLFLIGFSKKIFFADNIGVYIDPFFENPALYNSKELFRAFILFPIQIYFDFSGYVDMAIGSSIILGIELPINFNKPYLTNNLTNFWRSWHISLSRWFKDYVYIPLGGSKNSSIFTYRNLILTMSLAGLWHGASLNFIIWGVLNGLLLCFEKKFTDINKKSHLKLILNLFIIFNLWIVFRITEFNDLFRFYLTFYGSVNQVFIIENLLLFTCVLAIIYSQKFDNFFYLKKISEKINIYTLVVFFIIFIVTGLALNSGQSEKFIYFQF